MSKPYYYILDKDHNAIPCNDVRLWGAMYESMDARRVANDERGDITVSTVFLGLDHQFGEGPPLIFETMVFGGPRDQEQERYSTWDEAIAGHHKMCAEVFAGEAS